MQRRYLAAASSILRPSQPCFLWVYYLAYSCSCSLNVRASMWARQMLGGSNGRPATKLNLDECQNTRKICAQRLKLPTNRVGRSWHSIKLSSRLRQYLSIFICMSCRVVGPAATALNAHSQGVPSASERCLSKQQWLWSGCPWLVRRFLYSSWGEGGEAYCA